MTLAIKLLLKINHLNFSRFLYPIFCKPREGHGSDQPRATAQILVRTDFRLLYLIWKILYGARRSSQNPDFNQVLLNTISLKFIVVTLAVEQN